MLICSVSVLLLSLYKFRTLEEERVWFIGSSQAPVIFFISIVLNNVITLDKNKSFYIIWLVSGRLKWLPSHFTHHFPAQVLKSLNWEKFISTPSSFLIQWLIPSRNSSSIPAKNKIRSKVLSVWWVLSATAEFCLRGTVEFLCPQTEEFKDTSFDSREESGCSSNALSGKCFPI